MSAAATRMPDFSGDGFDLGLLDAPMRIAFARAVVKAGGSALLIDAENHKATDVRRSGWASVAEAVDGILAGRLGTARTYAVEPRPDMLALDCDGPGADAVQRIACELIAAGIVPVLIQSGQVDHLHLFAQVLDPAFRERLAGEARVARVNVRGGWGRGSAIRPPGAPHRRGLPVVLLYPANPDTALAAFSAPGPRACDGDEPRAVGTADAARRWSNSQARAAVRRRPLSPRIAALLRHGDQNGRHRSRSEVVQAVATAAVNAGWYESDLWDALCDPSSAAGEKVREMIAQDGERDARRWLATSWRRAEQFVDDAGLRHRISELRLEAGRFVWPSRTGGTDKAVLGAHLDIAEKSGRLTHGASVRQVAEMGGVVAGTVSRSHRRLRRMGWLEWVAPGARRERRADQWTVALPATSRNSSITPPQGDGTVAGSCSAEREDPAGAGSPSGPTTDPAPPRPGGGGRDRTVAGSCSAPSVSATDPAHDVWRNRGGLGKVGWRTFGALAEPRTPAELAARLGVRRQAVERQIRKLVAHGLAEQAAGGGWLAARRDLDAVAAELGVVGKGARQRDRHQRERARFDARLGSESAASRSVTTAREDEVQMGEPATGDGGGPPTGQEGTPERRRGRTPEARRMAVRDHMVRRLRVLLRAAEDRLDVQPDDERARAVARRACRVLEPWQAAP
jgi:DNA-binding MarR family transcriptional regulator